MQNVFCTVVVHLNTLVRLERRETQKGGRVLDGQRGRRNIWKVSGTSLPVS